MTREEIEKDRYYQLTDAAINYCRKEHPHYDGEILGEITDAFEAGAEWEHKRLVEKACDYLQKALRVNEEIQDLSDLMLMEFIADFRKAMEE